MLHSADSLRTEPLEGAPLQDTAALVDRLGAPPAAPCAMPKQQLEPVAVGLLSVLRLFGVRAPRPGL
ncbi:hypothetical protein [Cereibacter sediminicola]|uniref:hypothetical protein n=1 Tax=Cereibacter sediminicola TaxID=2584941 RepID=UPI0011A375A3|nr:hypothetical protein [Cereibacter sediminicola]